MSKGKRYDGEQKLNMKKVFGVFATILIIILFIVGINLILKADKNKVVSKNIELNYYSVFSNGNWGVINSSGETIIQPTYPEMIIIPNKSKAFFICTYEVNYTNGTFKTKVVNEKNEELLEGYESKTAIINRDENNNIWYDGNAVITEKQGKFGLANLDGKEILPCEYESITPLKGIKNSMVVKNAGKFGIVNSDGTIIVPVEFAEVSALTSDYKNGFLVKNTENKYGVIKSDGQVALECKYEGIKNIEDNNNYIVKENGKWKVISADGTIFLEGKVDNAVAMNYGSVIINENGKYGIIELKETVSVPAEYESLTYMFEDKYAAKKDGKFGIINLKNETMVEFKYADIIYNQTTDYIKAKKDDGNYDYMTRDFTIKLTSGEETVYKTFISIKTGDDIKYYNYKLEEKSNKDVYTTNTLFVHKENGKYGFVNKDGKVVVEAKYDDAREQNDCGFVAVKKDGKWGALDQYGNVAVDTKYELKNNSIIDFIGKWHVSVDTNANYYTDAE
ncbi:MAG: WG repeat-containing protein [Clostridia bacterium]|nr:WG repeat-containing protein [Clostridia bacterium]